MTSSSRRVAVGAAFLAGLLAAALLPQSYAGFGPSQGASTATDLAKGGTITGDLAVTGNLSVTGYAVPKQAMVIVQRLAAQSVNDSTDDPISWDTEVRDDLGISAVGAGANTKVCTFTASGVWGCVATTVCGVIGTGKFLQAGVFLYNSGNTLKQRAILGGAFGHAINGNYLAIPETFTVASGDYIKVQVYHEKGSAANFGGDVHTHCTLTRLGN